MAKILITSGPTRQYLDPIRYLSNGSSGKMGAALAAAAIDAGHQVTVISGPVSLQYHQDAAVIPVVTTADMLHATVETFSQYDGLIAVAAPCDYRPIQTANQKIKRTGNRLAIEFEETDDILSAIGQQKRPDQWTVGFALETHDGYQHAVEKMNRKRCDLIVLNGAQAMESDQNQVRVIDSTGQVIQSSSGTKTEVAQQLVELFCQTFSL